MELKKFLELLQESADLEEAKQRKPYGDLEDKAKKTKEKPALPTVQVMRDALKKAGKIKESQLLGKALETAFLNIKKRQTTITDKE